MNALKLELEFLRFSSSSPYSFKQGFFYHQYGGFQLEFVSISRVTNQMTLSALIGGQFI